MNNRWKKQHGHFVPSSTVFFHTVFFVLFISLMADKSSTEIETQPLCDMYSE